jgi:hypothetical protein
MDGEVVIVSSFGEIFSLKEGENQLGRGDWLNIKDKRCSRQQLTVNVKGSKVSIVPVRIPLVMIC